MQRGAIGISRIAPHGKFQHSAQYAAKPLLRPYKCALTRWKKKSHAKLAKAQRRAIFFAPLRETCCLNCRNIYVLQQPPLCRVTAHRGFAVWGQDFARCANNHVDGIDTLSHERFNSRGSGF